MNSDIRGKYLPSSGSNQSTSHATLNGMVKRPRLSSNALSPASVRVSNTAVYRTGIPFWDRFGRYAPTLHGLNKLMFWGAYLDWDEQVILGRRIFWFRIPTMLIRLFLASLFLMLPVGLFLTVGWDEGPYPDWTYIMLLAWPLWWYKLWWEHVTAYWSNKRGAYNTPQELRALERARKMTWEKWDATR